MVKTLSLHCKGSIPPCEVKVAQSCLTLCDPMDCTLPGSSVHGILQAIILEWVAVHFSRISSEPRDQTQVSRIQADSFPSESPGKPPHTTWCGQKKNQKNKFISLKFWKPEIWTKSSGAKVKMLAWLDPSGGSKENPFFLEDAYVWLAAVLLQPLCFCCHIAFFSFGSSLPSYGDSYDYIGLTLDNSG